MNSAIEGIGYPNLRLVRSQADAMAGAAMAFGLTFAEALDFDPLDYFACLQIADFKPQQFIDVDVTQGLAAVDSEGPNHVPERADFADNLVRASVCYT